MQTNQTSATSTQFLTLEAEGLLWEAKLAMAQGHKDGAKRLLRMTVAKLEEAVKA